ncbi:hypothetical protein I6J42_33470 [Streptomyces californicus]|uniref:Uncharacterized protein n=2 Tax=Streptomyces californicus TaxID=67351 RepID=A0ABD7D4M2_9ACTN|nr:MULTISPECIES: hypothetical protein [Streptomyces]NEC46854.1 hypothetical protein [Streptomyces sp. SID8016]QRV25887.1 hypothetical protein I6J39_00285 [Streptomyces californicus]QRV38450.1 hypothetical protein I6J42_33470 [Streptomyces californicus]QRV39288.1 hypothetical protein I6J41_00115 [Streptomyces californicus]QRV46037.1 hypothetical protein I6J43_00155 [Streptomyces californicus]
MAAVEHTPDYPPKTPPPKRPISPPRPETSLAGTPRARMQVRNRRSANWSLEAAPWSAKKACAHVLGRLHEWGYRETDVAAAGLTELLVRTAVADGGRRVSVHLADQSGQALIVALSHRPGLAAADTAVLPALTRLGAVSCGTDTADDGRRLWAVLDL